MGETIKIQGNLEDIFDCVNFYQNLSVVGSVSIEELKKSYIDMYLTEYRENFHEGRKQILEKRKKSLDIRNTNNTVEVVSSVPATNEVEEASHGNILGEVSGEVSNSFEEVEHGVILDEVSVEEVNEFKTVPNKENFEEVEHGIMLDDIISEDTFQEVGLDTTSNVVENSKNNFEEVKHGIILDDAMSEETVSSKETEGTNDTEKVEEGKDNSFDDFVWEDELKLNEIKDEEISQKESIEEDIEYRSKSRRERFGEKISLEDLDEDIDEEGYSKENKPHSSRFKDYEERDKYRESEKDYFEREHNRDRRYSHNDRYNNRKDRRDKEQDFKNQEPEREEKRRVKSYSSIIDENIGERPTLEYKNVRDYVKKHSGCSINDVCQYFSKKDVNKALMNVKIVKKKNKLYVV